jgi:hypothetical protein
MDELEGDLKMPPTLFPRDICQGLIALVKNSTGVVLIAPIGISRCPEYACLMTRSA